MHRYKPQDPVSEDGSYEIQKVLNVVNNLWSRIKHKDAYELTNIIATYNMCKVIK